MEDSCLILQGKEGKLVRSQKERVVFFCYYCLNSFVIEFILRKV